MSNYNDDCLLKQSPGCEEKHKNYEVIHFLLGWRTRSTQNVPVQEAASDTDAGSQASLHMLHAHMRVMLYSCTTVSK
jgi:hypothetical protein